MTYSSSELEAKGVSAFVRAWRKWRRSMFLSIAEAAAMADVRPHYLQHIEVGRWAGGPVTRAKLDALMVRWDESKRPQSSVQRRARRAYYAERDKRRDARDRKRAA